jgi:hypothetical protein
MQSRWPNRLVLLGKAIPAMVLVAAGCGSKHTTGISGGTGGTGGGVGTGGSVVMGPPGTLSVWTQGIARKIQPTTAPGPGTTVDVASARKAWASWQLVVRGNGGGLQGVKVSVHDDLSDGNGHTLAKTNVTFFREYYVDLAGLMSNTGNIPVPAMSPTADARTPDPLIPLVDPYTGMDAGQPFNVASSENQPVFIDVYVPAGTTAGTYKGTLDVSAASGGSASVPISVTVWNIDLPDMTTVTTHFKMSINALYEYHAGLAKCSGSNCYLDVNPQSLKVLKRYEELAHTHRIDTGQQFVNAPVNGCTMPSASDWAAYDASMSPYMDGSYYSDGVPSSRLDPPFSPGQNFGIDGTCGPVAPPPNMPNMTQYAALAQAWATHLKSKSWFEPSIIYAYDEPPASAFPMIAQGSAWMQAGDPAWKAHVLDTTSPNAMNAAVLNPAIGIYVVSPQLFDAWGGNMPYYGRKEWPGLIQQGIQLWFYSGNSVLPPYATMSTDTLDGYEPLIQLWGSWYEGATGFLYWDIAAWIDNDPWGSENKWYLPGDGVLLYPGNHAGTLAPAGSPSDVAIDGPIPSYRLKALRQGLQDWALFRLADQQGLTAMVKPLVAQAYTQLGGCKGCPMPPSGFYWKTDEATIDAARAAIAALVK